MGGIIWLASYPKSGNTWFRVFLANLRGDQEKAANINELHSTPIASARGIFDEEVGVEASDLTPDEIERLRPEVYEKLAGDTDETLFMKVHDAYTLVEGKTPLFPKSATRGAIYIIRNPLDVAVSFAHHWGWNYDRAISEMADENAAFCSKTKRLQDQLRQKLLTWSGHVKSWTEQTAFPVCILRYEDMKQRPAKTFSRAVRFAGLDHSGEEIEKALSLCTFEELQRQERENGFHEKSPSSEMFFRKGEVDGWREELSDMQVARVILDHRSVMARFEYLKGDGPVP